MADHHTELEPRLSTGPRPWSHKIIDLGGPDGGRYWKITSPHAIDHPDAHAAAVHARVTGSIGATYNDVTVESAEVITEIPVS